MTIAAAIFHIAMMTAIATAPEVESSCKSFDLVVVCDK